MPKPGSSTARGYGYEHSKTRKAMLAAAYGQPCHHCGRPMVPGQSLDLDHTADRSGYRGMAHAKCNRADGGRRSRRPKRRSTTVRRSRRW